MILCDKCGTGFDPRIEKEQEEKIEYIFFTCPVCGARYEILKTDEKARRLIGQRKRVQKIIKKDLIGRSDADTIRRRMEGDRKLKERIR